MSPDEQKKTLNIKFHNKNTRIQSKPFRISVDIKVIRLCKKRRKNSKSD